MTEAQKLMQTMDLRLKEVPEVERVFGKAGRIETSTDPAPFSMMETTILLKPPTEWRRKDRLYSKWPKWTHGPLRHIWPDHISKDELIADLDARMQFPGVANAWTMPIKTRIDMLTTGMRTPVGVKIGGADLKVIEDLGTKVETILKDVPGTRSVVRRAHERRVLPRLRHQAGPARALRPHGRGGRGSDHVGHRRRAGDDDSRRARAVHGERALRAGNYASNLAGAEARARVHHERRPHTARRSWRTSGSSRGRP